MLLGQKLHFVLYVVQEQNQIMKEQDVKIALQDFIL